MTLSFPPEEPTRLDIAIATIKDMDPADQNAIPLKTITEGEAFVEEVFNSLARLKENKLASVSEVRPQPNGTMDTSWVFCAPIANAICRVFQYKVLHAYASSILAQIMEGRRSAAEDTGRYLTEDETVAVCYQILEKKILPKTDGHVITQDDYAGVSPISVSRMPIYYFRRRGVCSIAGIDTTLTDDAKEWIQKKKEEGKIIQKNRDDVASLITATTAFPEIPLVYKDTLVWMCWPDNPEERTVVVSDRYAGRFVDSDYCRYTVKIDDLRLFAPFAALPMNKEQIAKVLEDFTLTQDTLNDVYAARVSFDARKESICSEEELTDDQDEADDAPDAFAEECDAAVDAGSEDEDEDPMQGLGSRIVGSTGGWD